MKRFTWVLAFAVGVPVLGLGIPVGWLWCASQLQDDVVGVGIVPVVVLVLGILLTYFAVSLVAHLINPRRVTEARQRRNRWLEPMAPDRARRSVATGIETYFVVVTLVIAFSADVYLILFGHPGVPHGP